MKILQAVPYFPPAYAFGGPVRVVYQISRELVKRGHEVVVYTSDAKDFNSRISVDSADEFDGVKVYRFRNLSMALVKKLKLLITPQLASKLKREIRNFNIVHLHEYRTFQNIIIHHYANKYGVQYILQAHGSIPRIGSWRRLKWVYDNFFGYNLLRDASKVIALNRFEAEQYKAMGVPEEKIAIIPNGIDLSEYANLPSKGSFKSKHNIPDDKKIILYLGRIHKIKGIDFLVKAHAYLKNKMGVKDAVLVIVGPDDGFLAEVKSLVGSLGISDSVLFTGSLYGWDKLEALVDAEVFILPSRYETFPMVLLEAYACGKPVIASNVGGLSELVIDDETGLLFEAGDFKQLAGKLLQLLSSEGVAEEMGKKARRHIEGKYSVEKAIIKLEKLYNEIASCTKNI